MSNIVGIDLGTTFSGISKLNILGKPEIVSNKDGERITASCIYFDEDKTIIGNIARNKSEIDSTRYVRIVKRYMGDDKYPKEIMGKSYSPSTLSGLILKKIKEDFEAKEGPISKAVITVPAYFDETRRRATMKAAELADIPNVDIVNEPTAAALYYASEYNIEGKTLVFDLGGGTFDITILEVIAGDVNILTSRGDHQLGGYDFDIAILEDMEVQYQKEHNSKLYSNEEDKNRLLNQAEIIKVTLSQSISTTANVYGDEGKIGYSLDQNKFNNLISKYIAKMEMTIESALDEIELEPTDIKQIVLVGGSSRIPVISDIVRDIFNKDPLIMGNVDECVTLGASIYAGLSAMRSGDSNILTTTMKKELNKVNLNEKCNHSYGTLVLGFNEDFQKFVLTNDVLIPKNTKLPASVTKTYYTVRDNQVKIDISVTQGESLDPDDVNVLVKKEMELPFGREEGQPIEVTYAYDENQRMNCKFVDVNADIVKYVELENVEQDLEIDDEFSSFLDY